MERMSNQPSIKCALRNWWDGPGIRALQKELYPSGEGSHATASEVALTWYKYPETMQRKEHGAPDRAQRLLRRRRGLPPQRSPTAASAPIPTRRRPSTASASTTPPSRKWRADYEKWVAR